MKTLIAMLVVLVGCSVFAGPSAQELIKQRAQKLAKDSAPEKPPLTKTNVATVATSTNLTQPPEGFGSQAYYTGRAACQAALKSPSSAKFSTPLRDASTGWQSFGYYQWKVGGQVEAKNPLGVLLKENWHAVVQYNVGKFEVVYLRVGSEESGTMPALRKAPGY